MNEINQVRPEITNEINDLVDRLTKLDFPRKDFFRLANISPSTWTRWKSGYSHPNILTINRVKNALRILEDDKMTEMGPTDKEHSYNYECLSA